MPGKKLGKRKQEWESKTGKPELHEPADRVYPDKTEGDKVLANRKEQYTMPQIKKWGKKKKTITI